MTHLVVQRVYVCVLLSSLVSVPSAAADGTAKVAFWNIMSGKGVNALPGHAAPFTNTSNCTDPSQPLNAWGVGAAQAAIAPLNGDPSVVALGLAESWTTVCGSPDRVRQSLGWRAASSDRNGVALVARYGFAGPEQWQQLDTSLNTSPGDTAWVLRQPVCLDSDCTKSMAVYVGHWYGTGTNAALSYEKQAQQTVAFLNASANNEPHVLVGDLNVWEGAEVTCNQNPTNTALPYLRAAGYLDAWTTLNGSAEGFTGMANRAGCGTPEGYTWKRIDYAWTPGSFAPLAIQRFAIPSVIGDASPSDHYGIVVTVPGPISTVAPPPPPPPPPTATGDVVLHAKSARIVGAQWALVTDPSAADGVRISNQDLGAAKLPAPSASPSSYVELTFAAEPGRAYRLWIRGKAQADSWQNDSTFVQFSGSAAADGRAVFRIGTTSATVVSIEEGSGAGVAGWGWQDNGYGFAVLGEPIYFDSVAQTLRIQVREDGLSFDQIVLSPVTYYTTAPGAAKNDARIVPETTLAPPPPPPSAGDVVWTSVVKATAAGSSLTKNGGCSTCFDAGAISQQTLTADGEVVFTVAPGQRMFAGLSRDTTASTSYAAMDYTFSFWANGVWEIRELNTYRAEGAAATGDVFKITVTAGVVRYYRNATLVYTSKTVAKAPLVFDASLGTVGAAVRGAQIAAK